MPIKIVNEPIERTTAFTDAVLAFFAIGCAIYLQIGDVGEVWKYSIWTWAFICIALSSMLGAVAHGSVLSEAAHKSIWQIINLALGLSVSLFVVGVSYDLWGFPVAGYMFWLMLVLGCAFFLVTRIFPGIFFVFIIYEGIALMFAFAAYAWIAARGSIDGAALMATGVFVSIVAAAIQATRQVGFKLIWHFDHNGIFHMIQVLGLAFLVMGLKSAQ